MSTDGASQQGADGEEYPPWFSAYLPSLNVKKEEVKAAELDVVLQTLVRSSGPTYPQRIGQNPNWRLQEKQKQKL